MGPYFWTILISLEWLQHNTWVGVVYGPAKMDVWRSASKWWQVPVSKMMNEIPSIPRTVLDTKEGHTIYMYKLPVTRWHVANWKQIFDSFTFFFCVKESLWITPSNNTAILLAYRYQLLPYQHLTNPHSTIISYLCPTFCRLSVSLRNPCKGKSNCPIRKRVGTTWTNMSAPWEFCLNLFMVGILF